MSKPFDTFCLLLNIILPLVLGISGTVTQHLISLGSSGSLRSSPAVESHWVPGSGSESHTKGWVEEFGWWYTAERRDAALCWGGVCTAARDRPLLVLRSSINSVLVLPQETADCWRCDVYLIICTLCVCLFVCLFVCVCLLCHTWLCRNDVCQHYPEHPENTK